MNIDSELRSKETWLVSEDGLWDLCIGLSLLGFGLTMWLDHPIWFIGILLSAYFMVIIAGKEVITKPRMMYWSIADAELIKLATWIRYGIGLIVLGFLASGLAFWLFATNSFINWITESGVDLLIFSTGVLLGVIGYLTRDTYRYYAFAGIFILAFIIFEVFNFSNFLFVFAASIFLIIAGIGNLVRFISRYPKTNMQEDVPL